MLEGVTKNSQMSSLNLQQVLVAVQMYVDVCIVRLNYGSLTFMLSVLKGNFCYLRTKHEGKTDNVDKGHDFCNNVIGKYLSTIE